MALQDSCDINLPSHKEENSTGPSPEMPVKGSVCTSSSRPPRKRKPKVDSDMVYDTKHRLSESEAKSVESAGKEEVLVESNKANLPAELTESAAMKQSKSAKRPRPRVSSTVSKPSSAVQKPSDEVKAKSKKSRKSCPPAACTSAENDPWREYQKTVELVNDLMTTMDKK